MSQHVPAILLGARSWQGHGPTVSLILCNLPTVLILKMRKPRLGYMNQPSKGPTARWLWCHHEPQSSALRMEHETPFLAHTLVYLKVKDKIMLNGVGLEKYILPACLSCFNFKIIFEIWLLVLEQTNFKKLSGFQSYWTTFSVGRRLYTNCLNIGKCIIWK